MDIEEEKKQPDLNLANLVFLYGLKYEAHCVLNNDDNHVLQFNYPRHLYERINEIEPSYNELREKIIEKITENEMFPYYDTVCQSLGWVVDQELSDNLRVSNEKRINELNQELADQKKNAGETEELEVMLKKANFFSQIGDRETAINTFTQIKDMKISIERKIDMEFDKARISLLFMETKAAQKFIEEAKNLIDIGGDWERRNRHKVYQGLLYIVSRKFKESAELLLECTQTFSSNEICSFEDYIFYTILTSILSLDRSTLKEEIIDNSEVFTVLRNDPPLSTLLNSFYYCNYQQFFESMLQLVPRFLADRYVSTHFNYIIRELRITAYKQFLEPYKSVRLDSMADAFGVTSEYLDFELSRFIASKRITAKIDAVSGIVETNRPDKKNEQYQNVIKNGDLLITKVQKLSRVIDM